MLTINLQTELLRENRKRLAIENAAMKREEALTAETEKLVEKQLARADAEYFRTKEDTLRALGMNYHLQEAAEARQVREQFAHLPQDRIFTKDAIRDLCLKYNLRFLETKHYKGTLDADLPEKLEEFMQVHKPGLERHAYYSYRYDPNYHIAAPADSFVLQDRPKDPLLFAHLGHGRWYLVHKWGNDLNVLNRVAWKFWGKMILRAIPIAVFALCLHGAIKRTDPAGAFLYLGLGMGQFFALTAPLLGENKWHWSPTPGRTTKDNWDSELKG